MAESSFHFSAARSLPGAKRRCSTVRKMARSTENSKRRPWSKAVRTLSIEQACQSRWKIRAGPILALRDAVQFVWGKSEAVGQGDSFPILHDHYDSESSGLRRALHSAPAKTTMAATKLHSRMATECLKMEYSCSNFAWR